MADIRDATLDDVEPVYELLAARSRAAFGISELSLDQVAADFRRLGAERFVAEDDGRVVGYAHLAPTHDVVHAALEPSVGDVLLAHVEERARARGFEAIELTVVPEDVPLQELVRRSGLTHERDVLRMWRVLDGELSEPTWPDGTTVRTYADTDAERVHALLDETYGAWDDAYVPQPHDEWLAFMTDHDEFDPALWFVVERNDELVACALHWKEHQRRGWVKDIVVCAHERGRGLGKALLQHGLRAYAARDAEHVGLKVDSTNPTGAPQLYERVGFTIDRRYGIWRKQL
ncbi:MAG: GNAT family N-acetyltransferase [Gaiellaceae bacterium]